ncbi:MAG: 2-dehydropantoate 2-reductase [Archangium sp.]|nr:2-dehydropantoate 2-reductase [Archangium sp.]MDP3153256.1 2-dehydropantoate 2-reductase [Archangium sp.]MDP3570290.1 2-dehydropantoate 2-reductase [Archangium sp.]
MKIGVFGAGSIGCYVGARLLAAKAAEVVFVGRPKLRDQLLASGLSVQDFDGPRALVAPDRFTFATEASALADCDVVLCCVKSQASAEAGRELAAVLPPGVTVVSLQNGVRNPTTLRELLPAQRVLASIVTWNVIAVEGTYRRATSGPLIIETAPPALKTALQAAGIPVQEHADIAAEQWTKLIVNLNNAISALSDASTGTLLLDAGYRKAIAAVVGEGISVVRSAGVKLAPWNGLPLGLMPKILGLPTWLVKLVTRAQLKVDPAARSSMWQDLDARRSTEVDFLNGEIVRVAQRRGTKAPLNARIVELIRAAETKGVGSPRLSPNELWRQLTSVT